MSLKNIIVTGGAGFIGSNFIHYLFEKTYGSGPSAFDGIIVNVDKLTYAGNLENLDEIEKKYGGKSAAGRKKYFFELADIVDFDKIKNIFTKYDIDTVIHFAAESHVDRSIYGPKDFIYTNIVGTFNMLEAARDCWKDREDVLFNHISTDEVFGSVEEGTSYENSRYMPNSPYAASKASSDHLVRAYYKTFKLPVIISNCTNNYGQYQFPEKLIPLMIINALNGSELPIYGDGLNVRDWLYVDDHCSGIWTIVNNGKIGEVYNISADNEWNNIDLINFICEMIARITDTDVEKYKNLIKFIKDRPGHDRRYSLNSDKLRNELNWKPEYTFEEGLKKTILWYIENKEWIKRVQSGEYKNWIKKHYG